MNRTATILILSLILGATYGWTSGVMNQNPHEDATTHKASLWEPSPLWLPSYVLCKVPTNGYGIAHTRSGFLFRNPTDKTRYMIASTTIGAALGVVIGASVAWILRRKPDPRS